MKHPRFNNGNNCCGESLLSPRSSLMRFLIAGLLIGSVSGKAEAVSRYQVEEGEPSMELTAFYSYPIGKLLKMTPEKIKSLLKDRESAERILETLLGASKDFRALCEEGTCQKITSESPLTEDQKSIFIEMAKKYELDNVELIVSNLNTSITPRRAQYLRTQYKALILQIQISIQHAILVADYLSEGSYDHQVIKSELENVKNSLLEYLNTL